MTDAMTWISQATKLIDCAGGIEFRSNAVSSRSSNKAASAGDRTGGDNLYRELFIVEGDSASQAVANARDVRYQAVLPMQGKPMNAVKASPKAVRRNQWFAAFVEALGTTWDPALRETFRYSRLLLLFDPDADGIHCGALMLMFLERYFPELLTSRRVSLIKAPLFRIEGDDPRDCLFAYSEDQLQQLRSALEEKSIPHRYQRYRGLASLPSDVLTEHCLAPNGRTAYLMGIDDAAMARKVFCQSKKSH
ncbi:toprim domain-containing protein [Roseiconus lacunae]|uniref:DNA topoisomerase (ATP-hydrolyzing) n=1 Tax=Roseiconus lacunae TaxID=2605694 RepID=A0ABT7PEY7_9BACT|nr:toprim domain-containing protein [Roseiconus lacunae]MDM4015054.1 toprim domain-containing protein [Roseiconus lacunae]